MASNEAFLPGYVSDKTPKGLIDKILKIQIKANGKIRILALDYKPDTKEHYCWYYSSKFHGTELSAN